MEGTLIGSWKNVRYELAMGSRIYYIAPTHQICRDLVTRFLAACDPAWGAQYKSVGNMITIYSGLWIKFASLEVARTERSLQQYEAVPMVHPKVMDEMTAYQTRYNELMNLIEMKYRRYGHGEPERRTTDGIPRGAGLHQRSVEEIPQGFRWRRDWEKFLHLESNGRHTEAQEFLMSSELRRGDRYN